MGVEKVTYGAKESFGCGEEGIGAWSDRVRDSGCGVCEVMCRSLVLSTEGSALTYCV